jgi:hypothetical protein
MIPVSHFTRYGPLFQSTRGRGKYGALILSAVLQRGSDRSHRRLAKQLASSYNGSLAGCQANRESWARVRVHYISESLDRERRDCTSIKDRTFDIHASMKKRMKRNSIR